MSPDALARYDASPNPPPPLAVIKVGRWVGGYVDRLVGRLVGPLLLLLSLLTNQSIN